MPLDGFAQTELGPRQRRGQIAHVQGLCAENAVRDHYESRGAKLLENRWRGKAGEVDLIFAQGGVIVFVEVKSSKTHARAAESLSARQIARVCLSAQDYVGHLPAGQLTPIRIDLATVDATGQVERLENISM